MPENPKKWKLWCTDKFGRSNDCYVVEEGSLVLLGLRKLWFCELENGRSKDGRQSFMYYRLVCAHKENSFAIEIKGENSKPLAKLIEWSQEDKDTVLDLVSKVHFNLIEKKPGDQNDIVYEILNMVDSIDSFIQFQKMFRNFPVNF